MSTQKIEPTCRVILEARKVQSTMADLSNSMRRLRAVIHQCDDCPNQGCAAIEELNTAIITAINELTTEWGL